MDKAENVNVDRAQEVGIGLGMIVDCAEDLLVCGHASTSDTSEEGGQVRG